MKGGMKVADATIPELYPFDPNGPRSAWMPAEIDVPFQERGALTFITRGILYRFFDAERSLLYLGVTSWIWGRPDRWLGHEKSAEWWHLAAYVSIQFIPYDLTGRSPIEREAIRRERPRFNRQFNQRRVRLEVRFENGMKDVVAQLRDALFPEDFAALVAAFKAESEVQS